MELSGSARKLRNMSKDWKDDGSFSAIDIYILMQESTQHSRGKNGVWNSRKKVNK